jgi:predicted permease
MVNRLPLAGGTQIGPIEFEGVDRSRGAIPSVDYRTATPGYFRTLQIPILNGRTFADTDTATAPPVVIIDEQLARKVLPGVDPIGRRIRVDIPNEPWMTIVGVAGHVRHDRLDEDVRPQVYWNFRQRAQDRMALAVRTRGEPDAVASSIAGVIRSVDPDQPIYDARTLEAVVDRSLGSRRLQTMMLGAFAGIALLLAAIGVYGVIAYTVGQRAREFGIRLALGASRLEILAIVMVRSAALFGVGAVIGLVLATASRRFLERLLYGIPAFDLASIGLAGAVLFLIAVLACCVPAWRATHVDPTISLRAE